MRVLALRRAMTIVLVSVFIFVSAAIPALIGAAPSITDVVSTSFFTEDAGEILLVDGGSGSGGSTCGSGC